MQSSSVHQCILPHCWACGADSMCISCISCVWGAGHFPGTLVVLRNTILGFVWRYSTALVLVLSLQHTRVYHQKGHLDWLSSSEVLWLVPPMRTLLHTNRSSHPMRGSS